MVFNGALTDASIAVSFFAARKLKLEFPRSGFFREISAHIGRG